MGGRPWCKPSVRLRLNEIAAEISSKGCWRSDKCGTGGSPLPLAGSVPLPCLNSPPGYRSQDSLTYSGHRLIPLSALLAFPSDSPEFWIMQVFHALWSKKARSDVCLNYAGFRNRLIRIKNHRDGQCSGENHKTSLGTFGFPFLHETSSAARWIENRKLGVTRCRKGPFHLQWQIFNSPPPESTTPTSAHGCFRLINHGKKFLVSELISKCFQALIVGPNYELSLVLKMLPFPCVDYNKKCVME